MTIKEYLLSLKDGERVIETEKTCFYGRCGTVYHNAEGSVCVMWDKQQGEDGHMGTSVTGGSRRVSQVINRVYIIFSEEKKDGL